MAGSSGGGGSDSTVNVNFDFHKDQAVKDLTDIKDAAGGVAEKVGEAAKKTDDWMLQFNKSIRALRNVGLLVRQTEQAAEFIAKCVEINATLDNLTKKLPTGALEMMEKATGGLVEKLNLMNFGLKAMTGNLHLTQNGLDILLRAAQTLHKQGFGPMEDIMKKLESAFQKGSTRGLNEFNMALQNSADKNKNLITIMKELEKLAEKDVPMTNALSSLEKARVVWANFITDAKSSLGEIVGLIIQSVASLTEMMGLTDKGEKERERELIRQQAKFKAERETPFGQTMFFGETGPEYVDDNDPNTLKRRNELESKYTAEGYAMLDRREADDKKRQALDRKLGKKWEGQFTGKDEKKDKKHYNDWLDMYMDSLKMFPRLSGFNNGFIYGDEPMELELGLPSDPYGNQGDDNPLYMDFYGLESLAPGKPSVATALSYDSVFNAKTLMAATGGMDPLTFRQGMRGQRERTSFFEHNRQDYDPSRNGESGGIGGDLAKEWDEFSGNKRLEAFSEKIKDQTTVVGGAFATLSSGVGAAIEAAVSGSDSIGKAFLKASAAALKGIAVESSVRALYNTAMGFAALATGPINGIAAAGYFKAAAIFSATAIAAGAGGALLGSASGDGPSVGTRPSSFPGTRPNGENGNQTIIVNITGAVTAGDFAKLGETIQRSVQIGQQAGRTRSEGNVTVQFE